MKKILLAAVAAMAVSGAAYAGGSAFGDLTSGAAAAGAEVSAPAVPKVSAASLAVAAAVQVLDQSEQADILFLKEKGISEGLKLLPARHYRQKGVDPLGIKADLEKLGLLLDAGRPQLKAMAAQYKIAVKQAEKIDCFDHELLTLLVDVVCKVIEADTDGLKGFDSYKLEKVFDDKNNEAKAFLVNAYDQLVKPDLDAAIQNLQNMRKPR